ncbi:YagK/YfjJ domain-containing protein [Vibrio fluvialis]|uniref:YagK/YfjJ domain-containing protein n=1 Tax=Vibrio fluvialis TaxID=676 RepID=UPI001EEA975E|nr:inovirus-type Gp2 protein [Vibrio fluvialis]MCG6399675.1 inovirus Gp2 family protein [Vibrio fluvialis]
MANRIYLPSITLDRTFEDYPLYYSDKGLYDSALTSMVDVFEQALSQFDKDLATRMDLYLPKDHQDTDLSTLKDYFEILQEKLNTHSLHYVWRKRADSRSHHYQVMLFTDYNQYFGVDISMDKRNEIVGNLKKAWGEAMKKHYKGNERSMVQLNDRGKYSLGTRCKSIETDIKNCVYKRMSSLAEAWSETRYFIGSSLE